MIITSYNGPIPDEYQQSFIELFEAIYKKNKLQADKIFTGILKDILKRHLQKPQKDSKDTKGDIKTLELLGVDFNIEYVEWLKSAKNESNDDLYEETNVVLTDNLHNGTEADRLIFDILSYVKGDTNASSYDKLNQAIEAYKR